MITMDVLYTASSGRGGQQNPQSHYLRANECSFATVEPHVERKLFSTEYFHKRIPANLGGQIQVSSTGISQMNVCECVIAQA